MSSPVRSLPIPLRMGDIDLLILCIRISLIASREPWGISPVISKFVDSFLRISPEVRNWGICCCYFPAPRGTIRLFRRLPQCWKVFRFKKFVRNEMFIQVDYVIIWGAEFWFWKKCWALVALWTKIINQLFSFRQVRLDFSKFVFQFSIVGKYI